MGSSRITARQDFESWPIVRSRPVGRTYGRSISLFISNGPCHLITVDVYEDGAIDCWGFVDRALFQGKLQSNWVVPAPKGGQSLSVFNFGYTGVDCGAWVQTPQSIAREVDSTIRNLNPAMRDLLDMNGSDTELRGKVKYAKLGLSDQKPLRRGETAAADILGASVPVLRVVEGAYELTRVVVFADGLCRIGSEEELIPVQEIPALYEADQICNAAPSGTRILLPGLGDFRATQDFGFVSVHDRVREIDDTLNQLNGRPGVVITCARLFEAYEREPSNEAKERLREAYEAVPAHLRCYCGDMDTKDSAIRAVLYGRAGRS
jgi:hypothetical protein